MATISWQGDKSVIRSFQLCHLNMTFITSEPNYIPKPETGLKETQPVCIYRIVCLCKELVYTYDQSPVQFL